MVITLSCARCSSRASIEGTTFAMLELDAERIGWKLDTIQHSSGRIQTFDLCEKCSTDEKK